MIHNDAPFRLGESFLFQLYKVTITHTNNYQLFHNDTAGKGTTAGKGKDYWARIKNYNADGRKGRKRIGEADLKAYRW